MASVAAASSKVSSHDAARPSLWFPGDAEGVLISLLLFPLSSSCLIFKSFLPELLFVEEKKNFQVLTAYLPKECLGLGPDGLTGTREAIW